VIRFGKLLLRKFSEVVIKVRQGCVVGTRKGKFGYD